MRADSDVDGRLAIPEDGQVLAGEMNHRVVACLPELKLGPSTHDS